MQQVVQALGKRGHKADALFSSHKEHRVDCIYFPKSLLSEGRNNLLAAARDAEEKARAPPCLGFR
eukprot:5437023-Amphidinium_carterae.2